MTKENKVLIILSFIAIYFIWGSTYMFNKMVLQALPPMLLSGFRFTVAGLLVFLIAKVRGTSLQLTKEQFFNTLLVGLLFISVGNGFVVFGMQYIDSGFTALIIASQPLILLLMMNRIMGSPILPKALIGVGLGILGIYLLISQDQLYHHPDEWIGIACVGVSLLCWCWGSIYVINADLHKNYFVNTGYQMFFGGILLSVASIIRGEDWSLLPSLTLPFIGSLVYLVIFGSILAFTAYNYLLKHVSPEKVSTSTYINPIVALFLGWWILDEVVSRQSLVAAAILLMGVYFINSNKAKRRA
jgi:drug/metabolite transporter (DMT)-like permease